LTFYPQADITGLKGGFLIIKGETVMYAIINDRGNQIKVSEGDIVCIDKMKSVAAGDSISFDQIMLVDKEGTATIGTPVVAGAKVEAECIGEQLGNKVYSFKFKRRKGFKKKIGHRAQFTQIKIKSIQA
jgi:large subunit ribosomal protein L21